MKLNRLIGRVYGNSGITITVRDQKENKSKTFTVGDTNFEFIISELSFWIKSVEEGRKLAVLE